MLIYILKSAACLAILLFFYKTFLEKENMHFFKRFYLLGSLVFALVIPTIVFTEYVEVAPTAIGIDREVAVPNANLNIPTKLESDVLDIEPLLWGVYFLGMLFFGIKFLKNLFEIFRRIRRNPKYQKSNFIQVLLQEKMPPHTFLRYIFLNKQKFESNKIPKEVLLHEETHAREKHSLDVLFVELLQVLFWVNPLVYFFKKAIKLNHEFLADRAVLQKDIDTLAYQNTLLSFLSSESAKKYQPSLPNAINYSSIKKRFTVMKTQTSKKAVFLRGLLLFPLLAALLLGFSQKKTVEKYSEDTHEILGDWIEAENESAELAVIKKNGRLIFKDADWGSIHIQKSNDDYYYLLPNGRGKEKFPVQFNPEMDILVYRGTRFIPLEKSIKGQLLGLWENQERDIKFMVQQHETGFVWDVVMEDGDPVRYYPKKMDDRYVFTYGPEQYLWSFVAEGGILYDNEGVAYKRIPEGEDQEGATEEQVAEYNALAIQYNTMIAQEESIRLKMDDVERLEYLYGLMSEEQRANAEPFPDFPEPPTPPEAPSETEVTAEIASPGPPSAPVEIDVDVPEAPNPPDEVTVEQDPKIPSDFPSPPNLAYRVDQKPMSKKLKKLVDKFGRAKGSYLNAVDEYRTEGEGEYDAVIAKYEKLVEVYDQYKEMAAEEGVLAHPVPAYSSIAPNNNVKNVEKPMVMVGVRTTPEKAAQQIRENLEKSNKSGKLIEVPEPPTRLTTPPAPPEPKSPLEFIDEMNDKNAIFYYNDKEISYDEAKDLLKKSDRISLEARHTGLKRPIVKLSDGPIHIKTDN